MRRRRSPETIAGRVNADGSIAVGDGFTVTKGATGLYTVAFPAGFRMVSVVVTGIYGGTNLDTELDTITDRSVRVNMLSGAGAALVDSAFNFIAAGVQQ